MIYLMMFACMFVLPSFVIPQSKIEEKQTTQKASQDSVVVRINFQNPTVEVKDSRSSGVLEKKFDSTTATNEKLISVIDTLSKDFRKVVALQQERRCESLMDRIRQSTGYSEAKILEILAKERELNLFYGIYTMIFIAACLIIYVTSFKRYKGLTVVSLLVCCLVYAGMIIMTKYLFPHLFGIDYQQFFQLLRHAPI